MNDGLDWKVDNAPLADIFGWIRNKDVLYYPNPGNAGDSLIAKATYQLFAKNSLSWRIAGRENLTNQIVVIGGGGNMIKLYKAARDMSAAAFEHAKMTIILPHTIRDQSDIMAKAGPKAYIFCREAVSYQEVIGTETKAKVYLAHDMAFFCDVRQALQTEELILEYDPRMKQLLAAQKIPISFADDIVGKAVNCVRDDQEKTTLRGGPKNVDISAVFKSGVYPRQADGAAYMFLEFLRSAGSVTTNRLHVGIGAGILGTKVILHDNSYGKNKAVYEHSIRGRYPSVSFGAETPAAAS